MASMSIMSLNYDCLINIASCLSDFGSFYNFALTCKRFHRVTLNPRDWHVSVVKRKAEFYIKQFVIFECHHDLDSGDKELKDLHVLFRDAIKCSVSPRNTFPKVLELWKSCGPIAAKLYMWIKSSDRGQEEGTAKEYRKLTIHLPNCDQDLTITTLYFDYIGNYNREITIKVSCGELNIEIEDLLIRSPEDYRYKHWSNKYMYKIVEPMKSVIDLLQKEFGETNPPIADRFLIWLLFLFPPMQTAFLREEPLDEEDSIYFKDSGKNAEPTFESVQADLDRYYNKSKSGIFQTCAIKWMHAREKSVCSKLLVEMLDYLVQGSQKNIIEKLAFDIFLFCEASPEILDMPMSEHAQ
ncbi:hypothetical protein QZH41_003193 [Actinostola sp. cb2023]|nr:hypothetical protein QZH41_003193 [Actinostola sp. cb2023]